MKRASLLVSVIVLASSLIGQTPSPVPITVTSGSAPFGRSLQKYEDKNWREEERPTKVDTRLVMTNVTVAGSDGNLITSLGENDFVVKEDDEPQDVEFFSTGRSKEFPHSIVLIIGTNPPFDFVNIDRNMRAAKLLVDDLSSNDKMAIVKADLELKTDFTNDKALLSNSLDSIVQNKEWVPNTTLASLMAVLDEKFEHARGRSIVIVQGAVGDIVLVKADDDSLWNAVRRINPRLGRYLVFADVENRLRRSNVTVYSVSTVPLLLGRQRKRQITVAHGLILEYGRFMIDHSSFPLAQLGVSRDRFLFGLQTRMENSFIKIFSEHQRAMTRLAKISGGSSVFVEKPQDADIAYANIIEAIRSSYAIGYYPKDQINGGKIRKISITVKRHPEYTVTTRPDYLR